jgi:mono/diheme cytochrome c family protein
MRILIVGLRIPVIICGRRSANMSHGAPQGPVSQGRGPGPEDPAGPAVAGRGRGPIFDQAAIARAKLVFEPQCGFCHGNDARGRAGGPDLARSLMVIGDTKGNELAPFIRSGRPERGMPAFPTLTQEQISDIAEFLHERVQAARNRAVSDPKASVSRLHPTIRTTGMRLKLRSCSRPQSTVGPGSCWRRQAGTACSSFSIA